MSLSFLAAAVAALAAAAGTGLLVREAVRLPRIVLAPWLVAAASLTIALAAQALGYSGGFGAGTFRAVQLGAQLLAPLALAWGLVEVTARGVSGRFAGRLMLAAVAVIAGVILATDPLSSTPFTRAWPAASAHYQIIPNGVLLLITALTVIVALVAVIVAGVRSGRDPAGRAAFTVAGAGGAGALIIQLLRFSLPLNAAYAVVCLATAALAWFAGTRADAQELAAPAGVRAGRGGYEDDDAYGGLYRQEEGGYRGRRDGAGYGDAGPDTGYGGTGADTGWGTYGGQDISDTGYGFYRDDTGGLRAISDTGYGLYRDDTGSMVFADGTGDMPALPGGDTGFGLAALAGGVAGEEGTDRLYGQIAIYTLLEGQAGEFDELARDVVAKVKAREPETLVYVMHGVPSAPMQRILYEVYRDQAAYEQHSEQPYVREFEERRKTYVLATNVIELGVRQAKVSPLPPGNAVAPAAEPGPAAAAPGQAARPRSHAAPGLAADRRPADPLAARGPADPLAPRRAADPAHGRRAADPASPRSEPAWAGDGSERNWTGDGSGPGWPDDGSERTWTGDGSGPGWPDDGSERTWTADGSGPGWPDDGSGPPRGPAGPPRSRRAAGPGGDEEDAAPLPSRRAAEPPRARRSPEPPPESDDVWSRPATEPPDDGDFWTRGSGYR